jgi:hypothetical protein
MAPQRRVERDDAVPYQFKLPPALKKRFFQACRESDHTPPP